MEAPPSPPSPPLQDPPSQLSEKHLGNSAPSGPKRLSAKWLAAITVLVVAAVILAYAKKHSTPSGAASPSKRGAPAVPVLAAPATKGNIGVYLTGLGTVTPVANVVVKTRVDGQLLATHFIEGQTVKQGDLLAEIDSRPYAVQVAQAEGQLMRDEALLKNALLDLERYKVLSEQGAIAQQSLSAQETSVANIQGLLKSDHAQLDQAKLNLDYARITAPIPGRVGFRQIDPGNMVRAGDAGGLVTLTQVQPINVLFSLSQNHLPVVLAKLQAGDTLLVEAYDRDQKRKLAQGTLLTVDNQIDPATGTFKCKATFTNEDFSLFPNQFVNVKLLVETKSGVVLAPGAALQRGAQQSTFVFVVATTPAPEGSAGKPEGTVSVRQVQIGTSEAELVEIQTGLAAGDLVVLEGVDRLQEGTKVAVQLRQPAAPAKGAQKSTEQTGAGAGKP